jgi:hypothetical protein
MKALVVSLLLISSAAFADIVFPDNNVDSKQVPANKAEALYKSLKSQEYIGDVLRTESSVWKIQRAHNGLKQTICEKVSTIDLSTGKVKSVDYSCTIQKSKDGKTALPKFEVPRRIG